MCKVELSKWTDGEVSMKGDEHNTHEYQSVARLLARKLGVDWRMLPRVQVVEYMRKLAIVGQASSMKRNRRRHNERSE
jgi:hypothetical protein